MNRRFQLIILAIFVLLQGCGKKTDFLPEIIEQFKQGNFAEVEKLISAFKKAGLSDSLAFEIEILEAKIERIRIDFSKSETEIKAELTPFFPNLTDEQLRKWESDKSLEMKIIDGQQKYFKRAVRNLFRIDPEAKKVWEEKQGGEPDQLEQFNLAHTEKLVQQFESGLNLTETPAKFRIDFTITLKPDAVPAGETVKCWMPFPRESEPRQKNVQLVSINVENFQIADNRNLQRCLFIEKVAIAGEPVIFEYSATFEIAPQYKKIDTANLINYDTNSVLYRQFISERPPHIVFTDEITTLANSLTSGLNNPYEKVKTIFYWIDQNIPWASAPEYSIMECIPEYVLQNRHGDCGMKTLLFMSMARSVGIPCKWQSGWMLHPGELNLHDWCEVYYEGIGWVPLDQSFGLQNSENQQIKDFYISGIDEYRLIINDDFSSEFEPKKQFFRSEPIDFQRGELEWKGGNLYFDKWDYHVNINYLN
ncbi:MAG: transglutaminase-like domain-containing protein [Draconibacterium sp.]|nr:transglutaminase-like domain-containing protein [Draconibacterium sp.]